MRRTCCTAFVSYIRTLIKGRKAAVASKTTSKYQIENGEYYEVSDFKESV
jgi:hypothetical protein